MYVAVIPCAFGVFPTEDYGEYPPASAEHGCPRCVPCQRSIRSSGGIAPRLCLHESRPVNVCSCKTAQNSTGPTAILAIRGRTYRAPGVLSDFGFTMLMHPHDPDCVYISPVESDEFRCTPDGHLRVYRTRNAGKFLKAYWSAACRKKGHTETMFRDAMCSDSLDSLRIYF